MRPYAATVAAKTTANVNRCGSENGGAVAAATSLRATINCMLMSSAGTAGELAAGEVQKWQQTALLRHRHTGLEEEGKWKRVYNSISL